MKTKAELFEDAKNKVSQNSNYNMTVETATWYAIRDICFENNHFRLFIRSKFGVDCTDLTNRQAKQIYDMLSKN